jgi:hypothetical protein
MTEKGTGANKSSCCATFNYEKLASNLILWITPDIFTIQLLIIQLGGMDYFSHWHSLLVTGSIYLTKSTKKVDLILST